MNFSTGGAICGRAERRSEISSMSKKRAPGIWVASYSAFGSRPLSGMYHEASNTLRSGSFRWDSSHPVDTSVFGSSWVICAPPLLRSLDYRGFGGLRKIALPA